MTKLLFDVETTGLVHNSASEVIEAFFLICDDNYNVIDELTLNVVPDKWEEQAEMVHGINELEASNGLEKKDACEKLSKFLKIHHPYTIYCYVNPIGSVYYDCAVIRLMYFDANMLYDYYKHFNANKFISVYTMAKEALKTMGYTGKSFSQTSVYEYLFNKKYMAHRAKDDVYAMRDILIRLNSNQGLQFAL